MATFSSHSIKNKLTNLSRSPLFNSFRTLPDFIIIGVQKGGTSSLYSYLVKHPSIRPALNRQEIVKEIHFFDTNFDKGLGWYKSHFPSIIGQIYRQLKREKNPITGEATPYYIYHPLAPQRVARFVPNAKIIIMLRNPVDRAFSHYQHEVRLGYEKLSFEEAIASEDRRLEGEVERILNQENYNSFNHQHYSYLSRGIYIDQIKNWLNYFPKNQILIICSESFYQNPEYKLNEVFNFLNVGDQKLSSYPKVNANQYSPLDRETRQKLTDYFTPKNQILYKFLGIEFDWN